MNRLIHIHIPQTVGNSLRTAIEQSPGRKLRVFPRWHEEEYHSFAPEDYDFYSGHIGYDTARKIGGDVISILRHPVERFISVYYFWRHLYNTNQEVRQATIIASKYSLDDFGRITDVPAITEELYNRMTFQMAYGASSMHREYLRTEGVTDEGIIRMAVENVETFAEIGIPGRSERVPDEHSGQVRSRHRDRFRQSERRPNPDQRHRVQYQIENS